MKDPKLSLCTTATRGIWMDLLCAMHEADRSGELRGTSVQLARLARCSTVELEAALTDLQITGAADVEQRNEAWVVANRRMKREAITREKRALAGSIGGSKTQSQREQTPDIDNDNEGDGLERVREFARGKGIREEDAEWFYWKGRGNGWTNGGKPILDWKATLQSWHRAGYLPSQKNRSNGQYPQAGAGRQMSAFEIEKRIEAINGTINRLYREDKEKNRAEIQRLKDNRDRLKGQLIG